MLGSRVLLLAAMAAFAQAVVMGPAAARPERIVSLNPCIDAVLLKVADPGQIRAISHWSHSPQGGSIPMAEARRFPALGGTAEEVISARPDLVLLTPYTPLATRAALRRLGIPMASFGVPATIAASLEQVRAIAAAAGQSARGEALAREIAAALAAAHRDGLPAPALMRMSSGFVPGPGSLSEELMANSGLRSVAAAYGLKRAGRLPLEPLALQPPVLLITDRQGAQHPIVTRMGVPIATFDRRLLNCGGPGMIPAAQRFATIRDMLP